MWNLSKVGPLGLIPRSKPWMLDLAHQNCVSGNPGELLLGIEPRISGSTAYPKPLNTSLHPDGLHALCLVAHNC